MTHTKTRSTLAAVLVLMMLASCAWLRPVSNAGAPIDDPIVVSAANTIARFEESFKVAGEMLLVVRPRISNTDWDRIADTALAVEDALTESRVALKAYVELASTDNQDSLARALNVLRVLSAVFAETAAKETHS